MQKAGIIAPVCAAVLGVGVLAAVPALAAETGTAALVGPNGEEMGSVELIQGPEGVLVTVDASGLEPGRHGFHIHQTGKCDGPDFESAGEHFAPQGHGHGFLSKDGFHGGDLPNLYADATGAARADYFAMGVSLADGTPESLFDADGSAFVIHERMDSYGEEAGSGGRVACGVIEPGQ
jgi:Cu-Zn family superoxide dismutase